MDVARKKKAVQLACKRAYYSMLQITRHLVSVSSSTAMLPPWPSVLFVLSTSVLSAAASVPPRTLG